MDSTFKYNRIKIKHTKKEKNITFKKMINCRKVKNVLNIITLFYFVDRYRKMEIAIDFRGISNPFLYTDKGWARIQPDLDPNPIFLVAEHGMSASHLLC